MKKIFTLIAMAAMAMGVNAQESLLFDSSTTYVDGQELTTENTKLQLGYELKAWNTKVASTTDYLADFTQTVQIKNDETGEMEDKQRIVYVGGSKNNPKDDLENKGGGFDGTSGKEGKLPQSGTYFMITPSKDGALKVGIILNENKEFFVVDGTNAVQTAVLVDGEETGNYTYNVNNDEAVFPASSLTITNNDGTPLTLEDGAKGGLTTPEKITATVEFEVQANHIYYVFCTGSKLSSFGYIFTPSKTTGITSVTEAAVADNVRYNLAGQRVDASYKGVVIMNGKKMINK